MNAQMKQTIRPKIESYVKRAEEIKGILKNGGQKKKAVADTANGKANSKDNKGDDEDNGDPDKKRMMQKFEGIILLTNRKNISLTLRIDCRSYCNGS